MLVCLAVWMSFACTTAPGKMLAVVAPITAFVALGFEHSVANVYLIPLGMLAGAEGTLGMFMTNIVMVTLGNLVGGATISLALGSLHGGAPEAAPVAGDATSGATAWRHRLVAVACTVAAGVLLLPPRQMTAVVAAETSFTPAAVQGASIQAQLKRLDDQNESADLLTKRLQSQIDGLADETALLKSASLNTGATAVDAAFKACPSNGGRADAPVLRFARNQATLDAGHRRQLDRGMARAARCPDLLLMIEAIPDNRRPERATRQLFQQRGVLIAEYLSARGLAPQRIIVVARGDQGRRDTQPRS
jgi:outer membrane protein OmpA-like peptidoglycan-associated protein